MFARPRPFPVAATLLTLAGVLVLCSLGHWQHQRLVWKNNLQAILDVEFAKDAATTPLDLEDLAAVTDTLIKRGTLSGRFDFENQVLLRGQIADGKATNYVLIPFLVDQAAPVFVVVGHQTDSTPVPEPSTRGHIDHVTGTARLPHWNNFTAENVPDQNMWYRADVTEIAKTKGLTEPALPLFYLESSNYKMDAMPRVEVSRELRNDHQQYMIFWYAMSVVLLTIYVLRFWRRPLAD